MELEKLLHFVLEATQNYGALFTFLTLLIVLIISIINKTKIIEWITDFIDDYREQKHQKGLKDRKQKTNIINNKLAQILINTLSDRAIVFEYHNNGANMSGLPFVHVSAHAEAAAPCLSYLSQYFQNLPATCFSNIINDIDNHSMIVIDDIEKECEKQPVLCEFFHKFNAKQLFILPIQGVNIQLGFIVIARNTKSELTEDDKAYMFTSTQAISSILDYDTINKMLK